MATKWNQTKDGNAHVSLSVQQVKDLQASGHVVFPYPRKGIIVVDGSSVTPPAQPPWRRLGRVSMARRQDHDI